MAHARRCAGGVEKLVARGPVWPYYGLHTRLAAGKYRVLDGVSGKRQRALRC